MLFNPLEQITYFMAQKLVSMKNQWERGKSPTWVFSHFTDRQIADCSLLSSTYSESQAQVAVLGTCAVNNINDDLAPPPTWSRILNQIYRTRPKGLGCEELHSLLHMFGITFYNIQQQLSIHIQKLIQQWPPWLLWHNLHALDPTLKTMTVIGLYVTKFNI